MGPATPASSRAAEVDGTGDNTVDVVERSDVTATRIYSKVEKSLAPRAGGPLTQAKTPSDRNLALRLRFNSSGARLSRSSSASRMFWPSRRAASSGSF